MQVNMHIFWSPRSRRLIGGWFWLSRLRCTQCASFSIEIHIQTVYIQRGHELACTGNRSESGFGSLREAPLNISKCLGGGTTPRPYGRLKRRLAAPRVIWPLQDIVLLRAFCAQINHPLIGPSHQHCPHYCNTIRRILRDLRRPPRPPVCMPYTIQYWQWQYRVKANVSYTYIGKHTYISINSPRGRRPIGGWFWRSSLQCTQWAYSTNRDTYTHIGKHAYV